MDTFHFKLHLFPAEGYTISIFIIFHLNTSHVMESWYFNITSLVNETFISSHSVRTMFAFGLEQRIVIETLGNSFQRTLECIIMATSSPSKKKKTHTQTIPVHRVQFLKACNCQKLNVCLKEWIIRNTASKLAQMVNMNNSCLNKHLQFPFIWSEVKMNTGPIFKVLTHFDWIIHTVLDPP